jgi:hypothetical protein
MRRLSLSLLAAIVWVFSAAYAVALEPAILDVMAVPNLSASGRADYSRFLLANLPRAYALGTNGHSGWFGGNGTIEEARAKALQNCANYGGTGCAIYAEDLKVVWPGRAPGVLAAVPGPLIQTGAYAIVPDPRFIWHGPGSAVGLYVWGHGKRNLMDSRGQQPQAYVRAFNNAGFDVVRFDRDPMHDWPKEAAESLRSSLTALRRMGWHRIVAGGQSRGGWTALEVLDTPGLADVVIAVSPAWFGDGTDHTGDLFTLTHAIRSPATRVAIAQFSGDEFVTDMDRRVGLYRDTLPSRVAALLVIDRPSGSTGHGGGNGGAFARGYATCLLHFVMDPVPATSCGAAE